MKNKNTGFFSRLKNSNITSFFLSQTFLTFLITLLVGLIIYDLIKTNQ